MYENLAKISCLWDRTAYRGEQVSQSLQHYKRSQALKVKLQICA